MINIITGKPGAGKTLYLAKIVRDVLLPRGVEIWSYERCRFNDPRVHYFKDIAEIRHLRNACLILDEVQMWFNARKWDSLDEALQYALQQHRHKGIDIWGAVQHISRIDTVMRELVSNYYEVKKIAGTEIKYGKLPKNPWGLFMVRHYFPEEAKLVRRKLLGFKLFTAGKKLMNFYDTRVDYDYVEDDNYSWVKQQTCPKCGHKKILFGKGVPGQFPPKRRVEAITDTSKMPF